jgi:hypothetical protein
MAGGACASTSEATANTPSTAQSNYELFLGEEEIFDTSLSTFYTFDKENGEQTSLAQPLILARGGCGGGWRVCWIWPPLGWCWGESTPAAKVASVASERVAQIAEAEEKR